MGSYIHCQNASLDRNNNGNAVCAGLDSLGVGAGVLVALIDGHGSLLSHGSRHPLKLQGEAADAGLSICEADEVLVVLACVLDGETAVGAPERKRVSGEDG
jgi:hypothetical protein